ncbi:MAG: hypothetical protein U0694_11870 [Anaerolineae bacterium]
MILVIVLVLLLFAGQAIESWRYVQPAAPGELLYLAAFDGFTDEWRLYAGRLSAEVVDSALRLSVGDVQSGPYSEAQPNFADFDVRVEATPLEGPLNNAYGLIFRLYDRDTFYLFLVSSDGYYRVSRRVNGTEHILSNWIRAPLVHEGLNVTNHLRVIARGTHFQFYINDQVAPLCIPDDPNGESTYRMGQCVGGTMQDELVDNSITMGQLGVIAQTLDEPNVVVAFDNLLVFGPEIEP